MWGQSPYNVTAPKPVPASPPPAPAKPAVVEVVPPVPSGPQPMVGLPVMHFSKPAAGEADSGATPELGPDIMIQQTQAVTGAPQRDRLGPDLVSPSTTSGALEEDQAVEIQVSPVGPDRLYRLQSENDLFRRIRQESFSRPTTGTRLEFPVEPIISNEKFAGRQWAPSTEVVEPGYVCYGRLLFEDKNSERYGWDLGFIQPFVSAGIFFFDAAFLPYHAFEDPFRCCECNSGYCLPGDPVPYLIYPPHWSVAGTVAEASAVVGLIAIFP